MAARHKLPASLLEDELTITTSRSSGPGGQNVNKVNSKVTLRFNVPRSRILTEDEKEILLRKLSSTLSKEGVLIISVQEKRSQFQNKEEAMLKLERILAKALATKKVRRATKPSKGAVEKRIMKKKRLSEKKKWRKGF